MNYSPNFDVPFDLDVLESLKQKLSDATEGRYKADTIAYPGQSSQKPKRKPKRRKRPKPKNRTVYR